MGRGWGRRRRVEEGGAGKGVTEQRIQRQTDELQYVLLYLLDRKIGGSVYDGWKLKEFTYFRFSRFLHSFGQESK